MAAVAILSLVVVSVLCGSVSGVPLHSSNAQHVLAELRDSVSVESTHAAAAKAEAQVEAEAAQTVAFNGGEHWLIGDEAWDNFLKTQPNFPKNVPIFQWGPKGADKLSELSFGQTVMMHADLYASMNPISNGFKRDCIALTSYSAAMVDKSTLWSGGEAVFDENFNILAKEMVDNGGKEAKKLVDWLAREKNAVLAAKAKGSKQASTDGYKAINALRSQTGEDLITKNQDPNIANSKLFIPEVHAMFMPGRFLKLAGENVDHFRPCSGIAYAVGHKHALLNAAAGTPAALSKAIRLEAMAQHFLTDSFSSGHIRVPRAIMENKCGRVGSLGTKSMHDEDGHFGLHVRNNKGHVWTAYGDTRLEDDVSKKHREILIEAMVVSITEVYNAYAKKSAELAAFAAFDYFPEFDATAGNHPPLLKPAADGKNFFYREKDGSYRLIDWKLECAFVPLAKLRVDAELKKNALENGQPPKVPRA